MVKKILSFIVFLFFIINTISFADDLIDSSEINMNIIDESIEIASNVNTYPTINSKASVVMDRNSKKVLYGKNENTQKSMASTTKIMTALVVIENTDLNSIVKVSKKAASIGGSKLKLKAGDEIKVKDLLYGLMLRSGNDAAIALAEHVSGNIDEFANLMNIKANQLNLQNTHFITPHGLDMENHYTTAYELAILTDYALNNKTFFNIVNTKTTSICINGQNRTITNTNELLGNLNGVYGVKTGFTNGAGRCLVTSIKRGNLDIICVVLGADTKKDRTKDSVKLIEYTFNTYEEISLNNKIKDTFYKWYSLNNDKIYIEKKKEKYMDLKLNIDYENDIFYPILKNTENEIEINILVDLNLKAPISKNTHIGKIQIIYKNELIKEIYIVNDNEICKKNFIDYLTCFFRDYDFLLQDLLN